MSTRSLLAGFGLILLTFGCQETPEEQPLRSLERSGKSSFVCVGPDGRGLDIDRCPDWENRDTSSENRLISLVTQTLRGEVALVDLTNKEVIDANRAIPGFTFLPVGANPVDIVSTPGGQATFVATAEAGKPGIYALPTSCLGTAAAGQPIHDVALWSSCALPAAPAAMTLLVDPARDGVVRASCAEPTEPTEPSSSPVLCPADLSVETGTAGRQKIAIALPDLGQVAILDAQSLLDTPSGAFTPCQFERVIALENAVPAASPPQLLPPDLQPGAQCSEPPVAAPGDVFRARPVDLAVSDGRLFVADQGAPLVHVIDVADPCTASEREPLLPTSYEEPERTVVTRRVAVSPITSKGEQFVYAIDDEEGSIMVFDVSAGTTSRRPLVRSGSPRLPFEPADRIALSSPARDVEFIVHDIPVPDPNTGIAVFGTRCDPDPALPDDSPPAAQRPNSAQTRGAGPRRLRGVFALAALANGEVSVIDVDDWDAACRRPAEANPSETPDFRGCFGDTVAAYEVAGSPTVSDEISCSVVTPHRARSASYLQTSGQSGARAPALRSFPRLVTEDGALPTDQTEEGVRNPKLLAVPFAGPYPRIPDPLDGTASQALCGDVAVGTSRYQAICDEQGRVIDGELPVDPATADGNSLVLPLVEPRAFATEDFAATYEGKLFGDRKVGFLEPGSEGLTLLDADAEFCTRGVQDLATVATYAEQLKVSEEELATFTNLHGDYVQITSEFPEEDDSYWKEPAIFERCGLDPNAEPRQYCETTFGTVDAPGDTRDLRITAAYQDRLLLEPRDGANSAQRRRDIECCFPSGLTYTVRAGRHWVVVGSVAGFQHDVVTDPVTLQCVRRPECEPRRRYLKGRVFEVRSEQACAADDATCSPVCVLPDGASRAVQLGGPASECVFDGLTARFAIYRGIDPSQRDMSFLWQTSGGFATLAANLVTSQSAGTLPQSLSFIPQLNHVAVADGSLQGLVLIDVETMQPRQFYF